MLNTSMNKAQSKQLFITSQEDLIAFAKRAQSCSVLAIDTEFLREKTYYPRLCLLQMATEHEVVVVDPFSVTDFTVLADLMRSSSTTKIVHAGSQDIEILLREVGVMPAPLFDTQVAATIMGQVQQIGLGPLVASVLGIQLRKTDSFTDWSRRPLSKSQLQYAADDVRYLPEVYTRMTDQLREANRLEWLDEELAPLVNPESYVIDDRERYRKLKRVSQLNRKQLSAAREVAAWREKQAQLHDIPRRWVITDEQIVEACKREARSIDELFMVRGIAEKVSTRDAREIVNRLVRGLDMPKDQMPQLDKTNRNEQNVDAEVEAMGAIVRLRARENKIALQTLASNSDLSEVARGHDAPVLHGWRKDMVGDELLAFLRGDIVLQCVNGNLEVTKQQ